MTKTGKCTCVIKYQRVEGDVEKYKKAAVKGRMVLDLQPKKDK